MFENVIGCETAGLTIGIRKDDRVLVVAGTCECDRFVSDADNTLEWANDRGWVYCGYCA